MTIRLIQGASFDDETTRLLGLAYERACEGLAPDVTVREAVAQRIIVAAKSGERDVERLIKYGLGKEDMLADAGAQRGAVGEPVSAVGERCRKAANSRFRIREQTSGFGVNPIPDGVHPPSGE